jgi:hypothetical protein
MIGLQKAFIYESNKVSNSKKEVDLHLFMVSTLAGLEGLFDHKAEKVTHLDEIWLYIPQDSDGGLTHLRSFLNAFAASSGAQKAIKGIRLMGESGTLDDLINTVLLSQLNVSYQKCPSPCEGSFIVLDVSAGSMNSRKAMITPFLPKLVG